MVYGFSFRADRIVIAPQKPLANAANSTEGCRLHAG
jgi:hypothetical protein